MKNVIDDTRPGDNVKTNRSVDALVEKWIFSDWLPSVPLNLAKNLVKYTGHEYLAATSVPGLSKQLDLT